MTPKYLDIVLPNGVVLPGSIFDDRNYVEINDAWLAQRDHTDPHPDNNTELILKGKHDGSRGQPSH